MANFDASTAKITAVRQAIAILVLIRNIYESSKQVQAALALYQAGTDPTFTAAVNALFSSAERSELGTMAQQINALVQDWEANHIGALNG